MRYLCSIYWMFSAETEVCMTQQDQPTNILFKGYYVSGVVNGNEGCIDIRTIWSTDLPDHVKPDNNMGIPMTEVNNCVKDRRPIVHSTPITKVFKLILELPFCSLVSFVNSTLPQFNLARASGGNNITAECEWIIFAVYRGSFLGSPTDRIPSCIPFYLFTRIVLSCLAAQTGRVPNWP